MEKFIYVKKKGMTSYISEDGTVSGVTVLEYQKTFVIHGAHENDSDFTGVVVGNTELKENKVKSSVAGFFKKHGVAALKHTESIPLKFETEDGKTQLGIEQFVVGDTVNVSGKSIGRGFTGTIKRHNFRRGPKTHGSKSYRQPGSIGGGTTPGRVLPGKKMAGQSGNINVTISNLEIVMIDNEKGLLFIIGSVPGKKDNILKLYR